jgi:hypothetical protein
MAWAVGFLVVIGAGVLGVQMRNGLFDKKPAGTLKIRPEEFSSPGGTDVPAPAPAAAKPSAPLGLSIPPAETTADQARNAPSAGAPASQPPGAKPAQPQPTGASAPSRQQAPPSKPAPAAAAPASDIFPSAEDRQATIAKAAKATEELDRERNRERGAAATAALDAERRQAAARQAAQANPAPAAPVPPPVPTIEQRARISSRIGLDEAARQLGGPLHAIDGMSRQLVGVVSPQLVPGSDTSRAVVRAVYMDRAGRLIFLDQQRVRPGQTNLPFTPQAERNGELRWMAGQVMLVLQSDLPTDSLRLLYRRIR